MLKLVFLNPLNITCRLLEKNPPLLNFRLPRTVHSKASFLYKHPNVHTLKSTSTSQIRILVKFEILNQLRPLILKKWLCHCVDKNIVIFRLKNKRNHFKSFVLDTRHYHVLLINWMTSIFILGKNGVFWYVMSFYKNIRKNVFSKLIKNRETHNRNEFFVSNPLIF